MEKDALPCLNFLTKKAPYKGLGAESAEKREPASDIDTAVVVSLKALHPERPIREADIGPFWNAVSAVQQLRGPGASLGCLRFGLHRAWWHVRKQ
jgi:hypothetical protein